MQVAQVAAVAGTLALLVRDARRAGAQRARARDCVAAARAGLLRPARRDPRPALLAPALRGLRAAPALGGAGALATASGCSSRCSPCGATCTAPCSRARRSRARISCSSAGAQRPLRERRGGSRLRAGAVRQPGALEHAGVRARRAAQRGRPPGHRPVGAAQPERLAGRRVRARGGAAAGGRAALTAEAVGDRRARGPRAPDDARRARRHVARALRRPARRHRLRRRGALGPLAAPRAAGRARARRGGADRRRPRPAPERRHAALLDAHARARTRHAGARRGPDGRAGRRCRRARLGLEPDRRLPAVRPAALREWLQGLPAGDAALAHAPRAVLVRLDGKADRRLRRDRASAGSTPIPAPCSTSAWRACDLWRQAASCQASTSTSLPLGSARTCNGSERRWWLSTSSSNE